MAQPEHGAGVRQAHRAMATALERDGSQGQALVIASHWAAAGEPVDFARWALRAAAEAQALDDHAQVATLMDQLLEWWDRDDVPQEVGRSRAAVLVEAARGHRRAGTEEAAALRARSALRETVLDDVTEAAARVELAGASAELGRAEARGLAGEALAKALSLADSPESTRLVALAAGTLANFGDQQVVAAASREAAQRARRWGATAVEAIADNTLGCQLASTDPEESQAAFERSRAASATLVGDEPILMLRYYINAAYGRSVAGAYEDSAALALQGLDFVAHRGLRQTTGAHLAAGAAEALLSAGNLTLARSTIEPWSGAAPTGRDHWWVESVRGRARLLQGDVAQASAILEVVQDAVGATQLPMSAAVSLALLRTEVALATRPASSAATTALDAAEAVLPLDPAAVPELLACAARAARLAGRGSGDLWRRFDELWSQVPPLHPSIGERWVLLGRAERSARLDGPGGADPRELWLAAESGFLASAGPVVWSARVSLTTAAVCFEHGAVARARVSHERATIAISRAGLGLLLPELARVTALLAAARQQPREALTEREVEVLRLLATGESNGQVAAELRISPRTVEVHVGRILLKLGAANRGAAVASALRLGILDPDDLITSTSA